MLVFCKGDKMEAISSGQHASRFNNELRIGQVYLFRGLGFQTTEGLADRLLNNDYYIIFHSHTQIYLAGPTISIPRLPDRFMAFSVAANLTNRQITGPVRFHLI